MLSESTYLSVPPLFGPNPGVRLVREMSFFCCAFLQRVDSVGLPQQWDVLWLAGCCTSQYFRACRSSQAVHVLAPTLKSARACCVFSRAESEVPSSLSLFPWKTSASWLLPSTHRGRRNFLALVGISLRTSAYCFILDARSCRDVSEVLFPHWEAVFAVGEEGQELSF